MGIACPSASYTELSATKLASILKPSHTRRRTLSISSWEQHMHMYHWEDSTVTVFYIYCIYKFCFDSKQKLLHVYIKKYMMELSSNIAVYLLKIIIVSIFISAFANSQFPKALFVKF